MFTPTKRTLTALTIAASLLTPISANAGRVDREESVEALVKGEILSEDRGTTGHRFVVAYRGKILLCFVGYDTSGAGDDISVRCND